MRSIWKRSRTRFVKSQQQIVTPSGQQECNTAKTIFYGSGPLIEFVAIPITQMNCHRSLIIT